ncbi:DUF1616 domain-containing protein [Haloarchaeobius amylolyticus]|uniref:DUF1616 domain-containing protein n=1 Tax=Haloarchaeobius amylolyticus TaxID=1198296 RepID=A0ABD6BI51_9EURY
MSHRARTWLRFGIVRRYPFDLAAVSVGAIAAYLLVVRFGTESGLRLFATVPLVLFLPGYALVSVLFPATKRRANNAAATTAEARPRGIDTTERLGLAFVMSLVIAPLIVLVLPVTGWGLAAQPIAAALALVTVVLAQLGVGRRVRTPDAERFTVSPIARLGRVRSTGVSTASIVLVLAIGAAVGALLVGVLLPVSAGGYTELALYSEDEDGELVAGDLPSEVEPGTSIPVTIAIENHEGHQQEYTVVIQEQTLEDDAVVERTELQRLNTTVSNGATARGERSVTPTAGANETVRISVLLYQDEPPATPTTENAAEETHFWVTVTDD